MTKKRGLGGVRGLDVLMGSLKKEQAMLNAPPVALDVGKNADDLFNNLPSNGLQNNSESRAPGAQIAGQQVISIDAHKIKTPDSVMQDNTASVQNAQICAQNLSKPAQKSGKKSAILDGLKDDDVALIQIDVNKLQSGKYQPRRNLDETSLNELAGSISRHGIMQPIVIRPLLASELAGALDEGSPVTHEIIAGERRWRAAKLAGLATIPAIHRVLSDELAIALALIENIQREDLTVLEEAQALERFHTEFGMSHAMIADVVGKSRPAVSNLLRLNQLHETVKEALNAGKLDMGHARPLLSLPAAKQPLVAQKIISGQMTVRQAEKLVKSILTPPHKKPPCPDVDGLAQTMAEKLGAPVKVKKGNNGRGSIEIFFASDEELLSLLKQFQVEHIF